MKLGGNFFEDLGPGQRLINPVPRTITAGDVALYIGLNESQIRIADERRAQPDLGRNWKAARVGGALVIFSGRAYALVLDAAEESTNPVAIRFEMFRRGPI